MGMFGSGRDGDNDDNEARFAELERRVMLLERALRTYGIPVDTAYQGEPTAAPVSAAVRQLVHDGKKIEAVRALVHETGMGLREAKEVVDRL